MEHATGHAEVTTGIGRGARARARRRRRDQELERRHVDRRRRRRRAAQRGQRQHRRRPRARRASSPSRRNGDVRLGEVVRGSVVLETRLGDVEVGIREGTAAWLDVSSKVGTIRNTLDAGERARAVGRDGRRARAHLGRRDRDPASLMPLATRSGRSRRRRPPTGSSSRAGRSTGCASRATSGSNASRRRDAIPRSSGP